MDLISELNFPSNIHIVAIISGMEVIIPKGDTILKAEDKLLIISNIRVKDEILKLLGISK